MGKHSADKFSKNIAKMQGRTGFAPQMPKAKMRLSNIARRGK